MKDVDPPPDTRALAPKTVKPALALYPDVTADTVTVEPGLAHGVPRFSCVVATPLESVVDVDGEKLAPDGPVNDTAVPAIGEPPESRTVADTVTDPAAGTLPFGAESVMPGSELPANAGEAAVSEIAGTAQAEAASTTRRGTSLFFAGSRSTSCMESD